jgi:glycosyltransferase involved in cell wall biosynthesis
MTNRAPTVTVLMSIYNGAQYLTEAVESILDQQFTDFEFLIVNDASTDTSRQILTQFEQRDQRIRIIDNPENRGLTRSLNNGINAAQGEFIARIDADDLALPGRLAKQVDHLRRSTTCTIVGSVAKLIDSDGQSTGQTEHFSPAQLTAQLLFFNSITHSSVMFRRDRIIALGGYNEEFVRAQDYDLWMRCLTDGQQIELLPDVLTAHRVHSGQVTTTQTATMEQCRRLAVQNAWRDILGAELSNEFLTQQHQLLTNQPVSKLTSVNKFCFALRSLRHTFACRFEGNAEGIAHFDQLVQRMAREACKLRGIPSDLHEKYVFGMTTAAFQIQTTIRNLRHCLSRMRFHLGKWRRNLLGL